jgi:predicted PurR-regulated permease PerM
MIALIDILPVLGVGTVLIPWSVTCFLLKDTRLGIGLLTIYGVVWVVRQIIEPKIIGRSVGIPPLLALAVMYTGYSLTGVGGLFLFPIAVTVAKSVLDALKEDKTEK